jgi:hypothetical protein
MTQEKKLDKVFKSPSTGTMCDAAQYIAEIMCLRKAEKENKGSLAYKFWNKSQKKAYQAQIVAAKRLITSFGVDVVIAFINSEKGKKIYSLGFYNPLPFVKEMLEQFAETYQPPKVNIEAVAPKINTDQKPRITFVGKKKSIFSKLKNLENNNGEDESQQ